MEEDKYVPLDRLDFLKVLKEGDQLSIDDIKKEIMNIARPCNYWENLKLKTLLSLLIEKSST